MKEAILSKLDDKSAIIGVIGLGYVGLPLSIKFADQGYRVIGFDIDPFKSESISRGESYISHIPADAVRTAADKGFEATTDFSRAAEADALIICVPTPLDEHRDPDLSFVINTAEAIAPYLRPGQIVSLESTTYPGTTDDLLKPIVERSGLEVGKDIFLVFSPEREDPGNASFSIGNIPKVCGGVTPACLEVGESLYSRVTTRVVPVSSPRAAELTKLLENIHRAVNIGLINEMKIVADKMGIDIYEVIDAAATKPFGFVPYYPGPGLGGHCIPIDPFYLTWIAREYGVDTRFIELAGEVNSSMPEWVVGKIYEGLNGMQKAVNGSRVLILGLAYKKNVDDTRESPAFVIMEKLEALGASVDYSDPFLPTFPKMRRHARDMESVALTPDSLSGYDCIVLATDHDLFDYDMILAHAKLIVDCRGKYRDARDNVIRA